MLNSKEGKVLTFTNPAVKRAAPQHGAPALFPKVYRLSGTTEVGAAIPPQYSLQSNRKEAPTPSGLIVWEAIDRLDPDIDDGWVMVRRHADIDELKGYINCQMDMLTDEIKQIANLYQDENGVYSLIFREPPHGTPDHLLIFVRSMEASPHSIETIDQPDYYEIHHPDGTVTHDLNLLYPFLKDAMTDW